MNIPAKFEVRSFIRSWDNRGYSNKLGSPCVRPPSIFSQIFNRLLFAWTLWIYLPNLTFVALPIPEIIPGTSKNWAVLDSPTLPILPNFKRAFVRMEPVNIPTKFEVRRFIRSWDNRGYSKKIWAVPGYAHAPFSPKILKGFCSDGPCEYTCQIWSS